MSARLRHIAPAVVALLLPVLAAATLIAAAEPIAAEDAALRACRTRLAGADRSFDPACLRRLYALPVSHWPAAQVAEGVAWSELAPLPASPPEPADNPGTPEKVALGRLLFDDPRLSASGQIACASCHDRQLGWGDGRSVSFGHDRRAGTRNAPSVAMSGYATSLFWDGRAATLEAQALHPVQDRNEMAFTLDGLERRLNRSDDYPARFRAVFGTGPITSTQVGQALAAYQRTLAPRRGRFDRFLLGERALLDDQQLWGLHLFRTRAGCMNCHSGAALTDNGFHNLGLHFYGRPRQDLGRYAITGDPVDAGRFRTPSLRDVRRTGPWMHTGGFLRLRDVVAFYNAGTARPKPRAGQENDPLFPVTDPLLRPLDLQRAEQDAIVAFLDTL